MIWHHTNKAVLILKNSLGKTTTTNNNIDNKVINVILLILLMNSELVTVHREDVLYITECLFMGNVGS